MRSSPATSGKLSAASKDLINADRLRGSPYCKAFNANDKSVCSAKKNVKGDWGFDVAKYAYKFVPGQKDKKKMFKYVGK